MKKRFFALLLGIVFLTAGCGLSAGSDVSDTYEPPDISVGDPDTESSDTGAPAGESLPDTSADISVTVPEDNSVSLVETDEDRLRKMVSFEGEFVDFSDMGFDVYYCYPLEMSDGTLLRSGEPMTDGELMYFFEYDAVGNLSPYDVRHVKNVWEYNALTGETNVFAMPGDCTRILYIDRDYIFYFYLTETPSEDGISFYDCTFFLTDRASGMTVEAEVPDVPRSNDVYRCGNYLFFDLTLGFTAAGTDFWRSMDVLARYSLKRNTLEFVEVGTIIGATDNEVIITTPEGCLEQIFYMLDVTAFNADRSQLYFNGAQIGFISPTDHSLFGKRYDVGRLIPSGTANGFGGSPSSLKQHILSTNYGFSATNLVLSDQSVAAVIIISDNCEIPGKTLLVDAKAKKAAVLPDIAATGSSHRGSPDTGGGVYTAVYEYTGMEYSQPELSCSGSWIYADYGEIILMINTGS